MRLVAGQVIIDMDLLLSEVSAPPANRMLVICIAELQKPKAACSVAYAMHTRMYVWVEGQSLAEAGMLHCAWQL